jgi:exodeoxyribonuclease-1
MDLEPMGEPVNFLVKLGKDCLPNVGALLVTGISPQETAQDGLTELEACRLLQNEVFTEGTCAVGFNNVRFDNEFLRFLFWRNFFPAYEWQFREGRSTWDILDMVRMVRALRPEGIQWPVTDDGKATNRLELLTKLNGIDHFAAHDALSDVYATIAVARLIREKQPQMFDYLLKMRDKKEVANLVISGKPFVYTSGRYAEEFNKTTVVYAFNKNSADAAVWDLRYSVRDFLELSDLDLKNRIFVWNDEAVREQVRNGEIAKLPVKKLKYNKCPAVAPLGVLSSGDGWNKIGLSEEIVAKHLEELRAAPEFLQRVVNILAEKPEYVGASDGVSAPRVAEDKLYDGGFPSREDEQRMLEVRSLDASLARKWSEDSATAPKFSDERLDEMLPRFLARNFYEKMSSTAAAKWDEWCRERVDFVKVGFEKDLMEAMAKNADLADVSDDAVKLQKRNGFILEDARLWCESLYL